MIERLQSIVIIGAEEYKFELCMCGTLDAESLIWSRLNRN